MGLEAAHHCMHDGERGPRSEILSVVVERF
jgi:hypothetical protein